MNLRYLIAAGLFLICVSCEKTISFKPRNADPLVVVEAYIENGQAPVVILSRSLNYFSEISPEILAGSFIRNADVRISNGALTHKLREYSIPDSNGYTLYYYSIDTADLSTAFLGELNKPYSLLLNVDGVDYTANTTIPALTKTLDSLWWEKAPEGVDTALVKLMGRTTDPPGLGNYIRYFTRVNNHPFYPGLNSVFDDQVVDGTTYNVQVEKGVDRNEEYDEETFSFFTKGDTATVKITNIDKATFDFWRTVEASYANIGNPFSTPTKITGNISGGALGYFGGYAAQYSTFIIPK